MAIFTPSSNWGTLGTSEQVDQMIDAVIWQTLKRIADDTSRPLRLEEIVSEIEAAVRARLREGRTGRQP